MKVRITIAAVTAVFLFFGSASSNRAIAQDLFGDNLFLSTAFPRIELEDLSTGGVATIWGAEGGLEIDTQFDTNSVTIDAFTPQFSLTTSLFGVGIGTRFANQALHLYSAGDVNDPFFESRILVENAHPSVMARNMLHLRNNGPARIVLENTNTDIRWLVVTENDHLQWRIAGPNTPSFTFRQSGQLNITAGGVNTMVVQPNGNVFIRGTLFQASDRDRKENFESVDGRHVLEQVVSLPISTWNYKDENGEVRHMGPTAQDFHQRFTLGGDDRTIATVDASGVALAAIQGLHAELKSRDGQIDDLRQQNEQLQQKLQQLSEQFEERLQQLEQQLQE